MDFFKRMGLQKKIFIYVGAGLAVLISSLTWLSLQTISQATDIIRQERVTLARNVATDIENLTAHLQAEMGNAAQMLGGEWQNVLTASQKEQLTFLRLHLGQHLVSFQQVGETIAVAVLDTEGEVLWARPEPAEGIRQVLSTSPAFREALTSERPYLNSGNALLSRESSALSLIAPVKDNQGIVRGLLAADIPTRPDSSSFSSFLRLRAPDYTLELVDGSGLILASSAPEQTSQSARYSIHWEIARPLSEERRFGIERHPHPQNAEGDHLVAFAPLTQLPWGVILVEPEEKVLALLWIMGRRLLLVNALSTIVIVGITWVITSKIVSPLRHLAATAQKFGAGDLNARIPAMGQDEIGRLAENLDTMRQQLKHSLDEIREWNQVLEQRVRQRTKELEERDRQLQAQNKERGDLLEKIITTQEEERQRIARELHDEVGQLLTSLMIGFRLLETEDPQKMQQGIAELKRLSAQTLDEVRHLAVELRPSSLDDLGLIPALQQYTGEYAEKFGVHADFQASGFEGKRLQPQVEIALYRIIQEALTNVAKHSGARKVSVLMGVRNYLIIAIVEDDGRGFDVASVLASGSKERKLGLYGMQERASLIGGVLTIESTPGRGTTVFVEVPLDGAEIR